MTFLPAPVPRVGVGGFSSEGCPGYGDYQGGDGVGDQAPEVAFAFELLESREGAEYEEGDEGDLQG